MRIFTCSECGQTLFFENVQCLGCARVLAYLPDRRVLGALEPAESASGDETYVALAKEARGARYRMCRNRVEHATCNWAVREDDPDPFCVSCRLNGVIPNLSVPHALDAWRSIEIAKRRLLYTLVDLDLPLEDRRARPQGGLEFRFLASAESTPVFTGHSDGLITLNVAEADAPFREKIRVEMGEAYRTLIGHFRHEIGHYYWDRLVKGTEWLTPFRRLFDDERRDYAESMKRHYEVGAPPDWRDRFVSAYATTHPWEDWAETWAHYLHMVDTLDTARAYGLVLKPKPVGGRAAPAVAARSLDFSHFDELLEAWIPVTIALNSLNRSMGLPDPYPFVLSEPATQKLRFVHDVVDKASASSGG